MNKVGYVLVFLICAVIGATLYVFALPYIPSLLTPLTFIEAIPTHFQNFISWIQQNFLGFVSTIAGAGTIITLIYNQVYKRAKEAQQQLATQKVNEMQGQLLETATQNQQLTTQLTSLQQTNASLQQANASVAQLQNTIDAQQQQITSLQAKVVEAENILKIQSNPPIADRIREIESEGYVVRKKIS